MRWSARALRPAEASSQGASPRRRVAELSGLAKGYTRGEEIPEILDFSPVSFQDWAEHAEPAVTPWNERSGASGALPKPCPVAELVPYIMQSTSGSFAPNPQLSLPGDDADKLSDYIPGSNEVSRVPSAVPSASEDESEEEEDDEEEGADQDGDVQMVGGSPKKTPGVLRKEMAAKERTKKKKEAKKDMDDKVRFISFSLHRSTAAETPRADPTLPHLRIARKRSWRPEGRRRRRSSRPIVSSVSPTCWDRLISSATSATSR